MYAVTEHKRASDLLDIYRKCFEKRLGQAPVISDMNEAMEVLKWAVTTLGDRAETLLRAYINSKDSWHLEQGFPLKVFKAQINKVIAQSAVDLGSDRPWYRVATTVDGEPVYSRNPAEFKGTKFYVKPELGELGENK